jgi:hypothetical protein
MAREGHVALPSRNSMNTQDHDPGGRRTFPMPSGMRGGARFSECGRYRVLLWREWGANEAGAQALWIGMNPSTANAESNDPTIAKEVKFTIDLLGMRQYRKVNVMDYRTTDPKALLRPDVAPRSPWNLPTIREEAASAGIILLAFGNLPRQLVHFAAEAVTALRRDRRELWCLGCNQNGSPKHPLYLSKHAALSRFS